MKNRIRELRTRKSLTQYGLARIIGCSQNVISRYELGQANPPADVLVALSKCFNVSIDYILCETDCKYKADFYAEQSPQYLSPILKKYRSLPPDKKEFVERLLDYLSEDDAD